MVNFLDERLRPSDWAKIQPCPMSGCWIWTGAHTAAGYGSVGVKGHGNKSVLVHRYAYAALVGPIPDGLHLDHKCSVRSCVNPAHLEPVTCQENMRRAAARKAVTRAHCRQGHPATPENTIVRRSKGKEVRWCRVCDDKHKAERRTRNAPTARAWAIANRERINARARERYAAMTREERAKRNARPATEAGHEL